MLHKGNPFPLPFKKWVSFFRVTFILPLLTKSQSSARQTQLTDPLKNDINTSVDIATGYCLCIPQSACPLLKNIKHVLLVSFSALPATGPHFSNLSSITQKLEATSQVMMVIIRNTVARVEQHLPMKSHLDTQDNTFPWVWKGFCSEQHTVPLTLLSLLPEKRSRSDMFILSIVVALTSKNPQLLVVQLKPRTCCRALDFKTSFLSAPAAWYQDSG